MYVNGRKGRFRVNACQSSTLNVVGNGGTYRSHGQGREHDYIVIPPAIPFEIRYPDTGIQHIR
jgi:hypothetical protein